MTTTYVGSLTLGQALPGAAGLQVALDASLAATMPDLQARLTGLLSVDLTPPSIPDLILSLNAQIAALNLMISLPVPDASATLTAIADLQATMGQLTAALSLSANFGSLMAAAGIHYFLFAGRASDLSGELGALLSGGLPGSGNPSESIAGAILLANDGGAIEAMRAVLRT